MRFPPLPVSLDHRVLVVCALQIRLGDGCFPGDLLLFLLRLGHAGLDAPVRARNRTTRWSDQRFLSATTKGEHRKEYQESHANIPKILNNQTITRMHASAVMIIRIGRGIVIPAQARRANIAHATMHSIATHISNPSSPVLSIVISIVIMFFLLFYLSIFSSSRFTASRVCLTSLHSATIIASTNPPITVIAIPIITLWRGFILADQVV
jgi:hypothetical protein